ncbi:YrhK family protein [Hafnia psychrotolerans]|uniref:YrhK domain-containing protein n=1 Tax=Hafnia psychrotolerans TaxID=1477018 RepID=A0ABQ1G2N6_9GAMM|nr:YrhK family protein [Hafnia psychrotolerans]GGA35168.1 hypothetical protein GCM10011328_07400 [Hafnia psychrotolerans]
MLKNSVVFSVVGEHIVIQHRYEALGALNDVLIALWFLIGSIFFLYDLLMIDGTWLFIAGSAQLMMKPAIKLAGLIHIRSIYRKMQNAPADSP